jgi:hypothetical protein
MTNRNLFAMDNNVLRKSRELLGMMMKKMAGVSDGYLDNDASHSRLMHGRAGTLSVSSADHAPKALAS